MKKIIILVSLLFVPILSVSSPDAATNSLHGGVSLGGNYDSNTGRTSDNEEDGWESTVSAFFRLTSKVQKGELSLSYAPTFKYNERQDDSSLDHRLNFNAYRDLSEQLRFNISDALTKTDDLWGQYLSSPATGLPDDSDTDNASEGEPSFSDRIGRNEFLTNYFSASLAYEFRKKSFATLGYNNRLLDYDEKDLDNYRYNEPWMNLSYWFSPQWSSSFSYSFTDAQFDISEDSTTHDVGLSLSYVLSVMDSISGGINYLAKDYETPAGNIPENQRDYYSVRANLGWTHAFSPQRSFSMSAGPAYVNRDDDDDHTTAFFDISFNSSFANGSWFVRADGGYDDRSFDALDQGNQGLSEYQRISGGLSFLLAKDLNANLNGFFRTDGFLEDPSESDENEFSSSASLRYSFGRWYYISGRYVYNRVNADTDTGDYDDHRFFLTLGFSKELKRW